MNYQAYEFAHAMIAPMRWGMKGLKYQLESPFNPFRQTPAVRSMAAGCEVFENVTRRYGKPEFGIKETRVGGTPVPITEELVLSKPFCNLLHFNRDVNVIGKRYDPKVLIVAPMSGHHATLLRGTVQSMIPEHNTYITDWTDARMVPVGVGGFGLEDFVDYLIEFIQFLGTNTHVIAVCQPSVPVLAAAAVMAARNDTCQPASMTLMGGPIDTRRNPTAVNVLAGEKPLDWFETNVMARVPFPYPGFGRKVYPGFVQLSGFMTMNLEKHQTAYKKLFDNLVKGDCDSAQAHKVFYDEYLSVMDLPGEFYLDTVKTVFQEHSLPDKKLYHRGTLVDCADIRSTALMTVEGENDDICGLGQTEAAHDLCVNLPVDEKYHYVQPGVGHYGVFNGTRWRTEIQPRIREFIRTIQYKRSLGKSEMRMPLPYKGIRQTREAVVEYQRAEPHGSAHLVQEPPFAEPQAIEPRSEVEYQQAPTAPEPPFAELQSMEPQSVVEYQQAPTAPEPQFTEPQFTEPQEIEPQPVADYPQEPAASEQQSREAQFTELPDTEPQVEVAYPWADAQAADPQTEEPNFTEPRAREPQAAE